MVVSRFFRIFVLQENKLNNLKNRIMAQKKGLTIDELLALCKYEHDKGNGNKRILIPSDDEWNEYHQLWDGFFTDKETFQYVEDYQYSQTQVEDREDLSKKRVIWG